MSHQQLVLIAHNKGEKENREAGRKGKECQKLGGEGRMELARPEYSLLALQNCLRKYLCVNARERTESLTRQIWSGIYVI